MLADHRDAGSDEAARLLVDRARLAAETWLVEPVEAATTAGAAASVTAATESPARRGVPDAPVRGAGRTPDRNPVAPGAAPTAGS
jgi:hypothetical protein